MHWFKYKLESEVLSDICSQICKNSDWLAHIMEESSISVVQTDSILKELGKKGSVSFISFCSIFLCLRGSAVRRETRTIVSTTTRMPRPSAGLKGCVILSACPESASGSAGWKVPPQKAVLAAAMTRCWGHHNLFHWGEELQLFPQCLSDVWLISLSQRMSPHTLGKFISAGAVSGLVLSLTSPTQPWPWVNGERPVHWELCFPTHLFYCHGRTSHHCRSCISLSFISFSFPLSFVTKYRGNLNSSTWGSSSSLECRGQSSRLSDADLYQPLHQSSPADGHWGH